jgi:acyl-CoA synthetase (NDP forming)
VLLEHLAAAARERGITRFTAEVLPTNRRMLATFQDAGYEPTARLEDGVVLLSFEIEPTQTSRAVRAAREQHAEAQSVAMLLAPAAVVVVGAGREERSLGRQILRQVVEGGFTGQISAVNRTVPGETIEGVPVYSRVQDVPNAPQLAIVAVPAAEVLSVVNDCAAAGVAGLVIVSSGFAESGPEGRALQREIVRQARGSGMRIIGPNAMGIVNTDPDVRLNASLAPDLPARAPIGFFCQSGALGGTILDRATRRGLGVSTFVSAGNRADVSGNDLLQFWQDDESTEVVLLYLESIGNPRKFARIARRLSRVKPVVAVRSGRSTQAYPLGHLVRRTELPPAAVDSLFAQAGVIETNSLTELFDVASILRNQPLPAGGAVRIVGNSEALAVLACDACATQGLSARAFGPTLAPDCTPGELAGQLQRAIEDPDSDLIIAVHVPVPGRAQQEHQRVLADVSASSPKPVVAVLVAALDDSGLVSSGVAGRSLPFFGTVEDAVRACSRIVAYSTWLGHEVEQIEEPDDISPTEARRIVGQELAHATSPDQTVDPEANVHLVALDRGSALSRLLLAYGIEVWPAIKVSSESEAVDAAEILGYPVAIKTLDTRFATRTDLGAVRLNLENPGEILTAFSSMAVTLDAQALDGVVIQRMAQPGVACVVSSCEDELFGPVVSFGLAGVVPELLQDRGYRIPPLSGRDARALIESPKAAPLLSGFAGAPVVDQQALIDLIVRVGLLADDIPELAELRLEPVVVSEHGLAVLGGYATLRPDPGRVGDEVRRL